jgi:hypothetical protein
MRKCRLASLAFAFFLLFAQQGAFLHAAWHANDTTAHQKNKSDGTVQGKLCDLHGAFGQVLGGGHTETPPTPLTEQLRETIEYRAHAFVVPALHVPLSRGPPLIS